MLRIFVDKMIQDGGKQREKTTLRNSNSSWSPDKTEPYPYDKLRIVLINY